MRRAARHPSPRSRALTLAPPLGAPRRGPRALTLASALLLACGEGGPETPAGVGQGAQAISANPGSPAGTVTAEAVDPAAGAYRGVMRWSYQALDGAGTAQTFLCTGTVIAPYTVLTAHHCAPAISLPANSHKLIWYRGAGAADDVVLPMGRDYGDPYAVNKKYFDQRGLPLPPGLSAATHVEYRPFPPAWLRAAWPGDGTPEDPNTNAYNTWGRAFDMRVVFVPGLTPQFIANNGIVVPRIDAASITGSLYRYAAGHTLRQTVVGLANSTTARSYGRLSILAPDPGGRETGSLPVDTTTPGLVNTDPGDSGGPSLGRFFDPAGVAVDRPMQFGVTSSTDHMATLASLYSPALSPRQSDAARLNALWVKARMSDADGDGIPAECDTNPAAAGAHLNGAACPGPVGYPSGAALEGYPLGDLRCPDGYVTIGMRGAYDANGIRRLGARCMVAGCVTNHIAPEYCILGSTWTEDFYLDPAASETAFEYTCPVGKAMFGVSGKTAQINGQAELMHVKFLCEPYPEGGSIADMSASAEFGPAWANLQAFDSYCPVGRNIKSLAATMRYRQWLTGFQLACQPN